MESINLIEPREGFTVLVLSRPIQDGELAIDGQRKDGQGWTSEGEKVAFRGGLEFYYKGPKGVELGLVANENIIGTIND